jgi:hypothetical protein
MKKEELKISIINVFNNEFEHRCINLLTDAYVLAQEANRIDITCEKEYISAVLFDYINKSQQAAEWRINIAPEYKDKVLKKKKIKKNPPKMNLQFGNWVNKINLDYFIETQNIIETVPSENRKSNFQNPVIISESHIRYITKIDDCLSNMHPIRACITGHILQGDTKYFVNCLNHYLCDCNRAPEILKKYPLLLKPFDTCYFSTHNNCSIQHLMFNFSNFEQNDE